jgi:hypothetical protein
MVNMDETCHNDVQNKGKTIAPEGVRLSKVEIQGDETSAMTGTASVAMSGIKPRLIHILRGNTDVVRSYLDEIAPERVIYAPTRCIDEVTMLGHLPWISNVMQGEPHEKDILHMEEMVMLHSSRSLFEWDRNESDSALSMPMTTFWHRPEVVDSRLSTPGLRIRRYRLTPKAAPGQVHMSDE